MRRSPTNLITIFQPYVPEYRVPLFETLAEKLGRDRLRLQVAHSTPRGSQADRRDAGTGAWASEISSRTLHVAGYDLHMRQSWAMASKSDVVIAELASTNLDTFVIARKRPSTLILWGHGRNYVTSENRMDTALEHWLVKRAAHLLLYSDGGREHLLRAGVPDSKMTVLHNSTDTVALRRTADNLSQDEIGAFAASVGAAEGRTAIFVGALDSSKLLLLLLSASTLIARSIPGFRLLIAGDGLLRGHLTVQAKTNPEIVLLPRADQHALALLGAVGDVCLMPGRVGLVAVDAMTLGLPIVTTDWEFHAPEREYLKPEFSWTTWQDPAKYAEQVIDLLRTPASLQTAAQAAKQASQGYSVEAMAAGMQSAILRVRNS